MDAKEYVETLMEMEETPMSSRVFHGLLGIVSEVDELYGAMTVEEFRLEVGDCWAYAVLLGDSVSLIKPSLVSMMDALPVIHDDRLLNENHPENTTSDPSRDWMSYKLHRTKEFVSSMSNFADNLKKVMYGDPPDNVLSSFNGMMTNLSILYPHDEAWRLNIEKAKKRFPDGKFTSEAWKKAKKDESLDG